MIYIPFRTRFIIRTGVSLSVLLAAAACGESDEAADPTVDASVPAVDASVPAVDASVPDSMPPDASSPTPDASLADAAPLCEPRIGTAVIEHSCLHGCFGPFVDLTAGELSAADPPDIDKIHTTFRIGLHQVEDSWVGVVTYSSKESGYHSLSMDADTPLLIERADGQELPAIAAHPLDGCDSIFETCSGPTLGYVKVFDLVADERYRIEIQPTNRDQVNIVAEVMADFAPDEWAERCDL